MSLYEIPTDCNDTELDHNDDYARWLFEVARAEWEAEQALEDEDEDAALAEEEQDQAA